MATINITVQSLLNTARYDLQIVDTAGTIGDLKDAMVVNFGYSLAWYDLVFNNEILNTANTIGSYGIVEGSSLRTHNKISRLATREDRQIAKLDLSSLKRVELTDTRPYYSITELPTQYDGNNVVDNPNAGGLILGRPWVPLSYTISPASASTDEGATITYDIVTVGVADGATLYWTNLGTTTASDFDDNTNSGSFTVSGNIQLSQGSVVRAVKNDSLTEDAQSIILQLRTTSTSGPVVATASTVTVNDTSLDLNVAYESYVSGGAPITFSGGYSRQLIEIKSTNFDGTATTGSYIKVNGTIIASDYSIGTGTTMPRGHTLAIINESTGVPISITSYDTYLSGAASTSLAAALAAVTTGRIIAIGTYDATALTAGVRDALRTHYGSLASASDTWTARRRSHIFVSVKN